MKKPKILMLQVYTREITGISRISFDVNADYCMRHGYEYRFADVGYLQDNGIHPSWGKVYEAVLDLNSKRPFDYIFALDADAMVVKPEIKLEDIIAQAPDAAMIISENGANGGSLMNCGSFILKKGATAATLMNKAFVEGIKTKKRMERYWEQCIINEMYEQSEELRKQVKVLPMRAINSHWKDEAEQCPFIWHLMARKNEERFALMARWYMDVFLPGKLAYAVEGQRIRSHGKTVVLPAKPADIPDDGGDMGKHVLVNIVGQLQKAKALQAAKATQLAKQAAAQGRQPSQGATQAVIKAVAGIAPAAQTAKV